MSEQDSLQNSGTLF